ncbi:MULTISPECIES: 4-oxalocrotonate tautomerase [Paraburkholderia]|jgi:4-oxalocrotonate tautomerase|uniref:4-oxalocrotonate tautomerase n=1 Tax=Paraburkholderia tropica TaxID=92647 RepID=A0A1A5X3S0_9BURK|nr:MULTISPECIES: 4-oxalocrotonate tautomerase [Paraburkholderia]MBB2980673.1 4-oxalocrotonate tautomerase [Paraburkholderia tropica]MBB3003344.1 4-oxalocrotonate tautomerase [Paraburkholderia tropica]MBB6322360.1 4-oxalocrotonate tautomerase [Paraburkholderia tropica]MBN3809765.1 4-oxalocrotonate tautomerase [Paraburkholderia sp. Ac-20347]MDE1140044.1 4-oxalocrotonate tautomerase [Paraburkholderia tropica]
MPILRIEMHPGKTLEQKRELASGITRVFVETLACPPEVVEIVFNEIEKDAWAVGGKLKSDT